MPEKAPVAFFAYKRPGHAMKSLESLSRCEGAGETELFIYCDGPKKDADRAMVEEARRAVKSKKWCGRVEVIEREKNMGLADSVITGVTELCERYGRVIVVEDDLIVSRWFLEYMNAALSRYEGEEKVMQVSAHMFPVELNAPTDAVFLPTTTSWGWGTWQRAWAHFDKEMKGYEALKNDPALRKGFDLDGAYPYFNMLEAQREGKVDSWAIRWHLSVFMRGGLTLFPSKSLVDNTGFDGSGEHCSAGEAGFAQGLEEFRVMRMPEKVEAPVEQYKIFRGFLEKRKGLRNAFEKIVHRFF